jgi:ElaB/YqjD/DUF883 family membrane-anchored ribosome-binding protein
MGADAVVSRELRSLQDELLTSQRERATAEPLTTAPASATPVPSAAPAETAEEHELRQQLRELVNEVTTFFEEAEKNISMHPTESVVGALLVGVLIGRLLGRR